MEKKEAKVDLSQTCREMDEVPNLLLLHRLGFHSQQESSKGLERTVENVRGQV